MTISTYNDAFDLPAGLGLTALSRPRYRPLSWLSRLVLRFRISQAISAVRADLKSMPTFVLNDIGIPADEIDRIARSARLVIIRRAIKAQLDRSRRKGGFGWTT
jgi:uncharacterized protein YjiS (DUF1127 family)